MNNFGKIKTKILRKLMESYSSKNKSEMKSILKIIKENKEFKEMYLFYEEIEEKYFEDKEVAKLYVEELNNILKHKSKNIYEYMCTDFINAVRECFKDGGYLQKYSDGDEKGGTFLVAYKNRLFRIENDFQVAESLNGIDAVGCGANYALGSLYILNKQNLTPKEKVLKSLETASFFSAGVSKPFVINGT